MIHTFILQEIVTTINFRNTISDAFMCFPFGQLRPHVGHRKSSLLQDNKDYCFLADYRKGLTRAQNVHKKQNIPTISQGKKQVLIENAFKRVYKSADMTQEQRIELFSKAKNCA